VVDTEPTIYYIECHGYKHKGACYKSTNHTEIRLVSKKEVDKITLCEACEIEYSIITKYGDKLNIGMAGIDVICEIRKLATKALEQSELFNDEEIDYLKQFAFKEASNES